MTVRDVPTSLILAAMILFMPSDVYAFCRCKVATVVLSELRVFSRTQKMFLSLAQDGNSCNLLLNRSALRNTFYALRHGRSLANEAGIIAASPEAACSRYGLSPKGFEQARKVGGQLLSALEGQNVTLVSSDLLRAVETARTVQKSLQDAGCAVELTLDTQLRERGFGIWDGLSDSNYPRVWKNDEIDSSHTIDGVESVDSVTQRATSCVVDLDKLYIGNHVFVLVAHGDVLQILQTAFLKREGKFHRQVEHLETAQLRLLQLAPTTGSTLS
jgi:probable phosphoglycerate mutase